MLTLSEAEELLRILCERLGLCIPTPAKTILAAVPATPEEMVDLVLREDGVDPLAPESRSLRAQAVQLASTAYERAVLARLRSAVAALSQDAETQLRLFSPGVCIPDELALEFDNWLAVAQSNGYVTRVVWAQLRALGEKLNSMSPSGPDYSPTVWTIDGLRNSAHWDEVRQQARMARAALNWQDPATFVF